MIDRGRLRQAGMEREELKLVLKRGVKGVKG